MTTGDPTCTRCGEYLSLHYPDGIWNSCPNYEHRCICGCPGVDPAYNTGHYERLFGIPSPMTINISGPIIGTVDG